MATLTIIVGMAGSGKSWLCRETAKHRGIVKFEDATLTTDKRRAGHGSFAEVVARLLGKSEDCVMDESHLTHAEFRLKFKDFCDTFLANVRQQWVFFEPDVLACINNVYADRHRDGRPRRFEALNNQREYYKSVPCEQEFPGRIVKPVYQCRDPHFAVEGEAIRWLQEKVESLKLA